MTTSDGAPTGPLAGIRVVDASTILAGPLACQTPRRLRRRGDQDRAPDRRRRHARARSVQGRHPDLVVGDLSQQAHTRAEPVLARGRRGVPAAGRHRRRRRRELPARHPGALGPRSRPAPRAQPRPGARADHRLRPDRAVRRARRLRHPRRGDERLRAPHRRGRRPADAAGVRPGRLDLRDRGVVGDLDGALRARAQRRPRPGPRPEPAGADHGRGRPRPVGLPADRRRRHPARQPLHEQRAAQHLPHLRRPLGRDLHQRPGDRRAGAPAGRPPRGHRRAVVRLRAHPRAARRPARRVRRRLDRVAHPGRGGGRVHRRRRRDRPDLQRPGPGRGRARPGDRDAHRGRRPGARPGAPAQRDVADVRDPGRDPLRRPPARRRHRRRTRRARPLARRDRPSSATRK